MATRTLLFALSATLMMSAAVSAQAAELDAMLDNQAALNDDELADMRGGFLVAGGAQFDFGASIKTMVNGQVALQTSLQWTSAGVMTQQLAGLGRSIQTQVNDVVASSLNQAGIASPVGNNAVGSPSDVTSTAAGNINEAVAGAASAPVAPAQSAAATAVAAAASPTSSMSPIVASADSTPSTASTPAAASAPVASAPAVVTGIQVPGAGGSTQVFANLTPGQIQSFILNTASGQNITQNTDITFTIYNFQAWQQQLAERMVGVRLASDMLAASGFAAGH